MNKGKIDYKSIHGQVAKLILDDRDGEWKISRFLRRRERMPIVASTNCVRPQQATRHVEREK